MTLSQVGSDLSFMTLSQAGSRLSFCKAALKPPTPDL